MYLSTDIKFCNDLIENRTCTITYSGTLFKNNSNSVTIVYGFDDEWKNTTEQIMTKTENGFTAKIKLLEFTNLNFCFKNSNNEWDNNNNFNYTAPISKILEENFIINENILEHILDNIFSCDLSEITKENIIHSTTQETTTKPIENTANEFTSQESIPDVTRENISLDAVSNIINENINLEQVSENSETLNSEIVNEPLTTSYSENIIPENLFYNIEDNISDEDFSIDFTQNSNFDMNSFVEDILSPITQSSVLSDSVLPTEENITNELEVENFETVTFNDTQSCIKPLNFNIEENISLNSDNSNDKITITEPNTALSNNQNKTENNTLLAEQNSFEEDKKIDNLIDNLINNLYKKANSNDEISKINIIDNNTTSIVDSNLEKTENTSSENIIDTLINKITTENISNIPEIEKIVPKTAKPETEISEKVENKVETIEESLFDSISTDIPKIKQHSETALIETTDNFIVSSKSLSKFYMMRKKIKLAFYKLIALPKIIFGSNEN